MNKKILVFIMLILFSFISQKIYAFEFIVRGSANEMYDNNINSSVDESESDCITNIMMGAVIRSEGRTRELELGGNIYQTYHLENEEMNEFYQDANLSINKNFTENFSLGITDTFQHYPAAQNFNTMFDRSETEEGYKQNNLTSSIILYITKNFFLNGVYNNSIVENESEEVADSILHNPGCVIGYYFNSANIVRAGYMYSLREYDDNTRARGDRGYTEYERYLTKQLRGIIHGGYDYIDTEEGESLSTRWMISLIDDVDENNRLNLTFLKESAISNIDNDTLNSWTISGILSRQVSDRTSVDIVVFYGNGFYEESREKNKLVGASFNIAYAISEFVNLNAGYTFRWSSTEIPENDEESYNRSQIYAGISGEY